VIRLALAGPDTLILSDLCARCPMGPAGCCAAPPGVEWSDVGRIVIHGGRSFVLQRIADGSLRPGPRGLLIRRVGDDPKRCVFLGAAGCTLPPERRAATCNYYVCEDALADPGDASPEAARAAVAALTDAFAAWDRAIAAEVAERWPEGAPWDEAFVDWLGERFAALSAPPPDRPARGRG
jgi:hypothetical protein